MLPSTLIFGLSSYNLFFLLQANISFIIEHGMRAIMDGALIEIALLAFYGSISLVAYIIFKACEKRLVDLLTRKEN